MYIYMVTGQNVDKPKRQQPKRRQTKTSTYQNVDRPKRRQTETSTNETSTNQNVDKLLTWKNANAVKIAIFQKFKDKHPCMWHLLFINVDLATPWCDLSRDWIALAGNNPYHISITGLPKSGCIVGLVSSLRSGGDTA